MVPGEHLHEAPSILTGSMGRVICARLSTVKGKIAGLSGCSIFLGDGEEKGIQGIRNSETAAGQGRSF